jgi:hypothetical protein
MSRRIIFQEFHATSGDIIQFIPFVHAFNVFESPLFYSHYNCEGKVTVIPSAMGTNQGDPLGGALFALVHFKALCSTSNRFPLVYFPLLQMTLTS